MYVAFLQTPDFIKQYENYLSSSYKHMFFLLQIPAYRNSEITPTLVTLTAGVSTSATTRGAQFPCAVVISIDMTMNFKSVPQMLAAIYHVTNEKARSIIISVQIN